MIKLTKDKNNKVIAEYNDTEIKRNMCSWANCLLHLCNWDCPALSNKSEMLTYSEARERWKNHETTVQKNCVVEVSETKIGRLTVVLNKEQSHVESICRFINCDVINDFCRQCPVREIKHDTNVTEKEAIEIVKKNMKKV